MAGTLRRHIGMRRGRAGKALRSAILLLAATGALFGMATAASAENPGRPDRKEKAASREARVYRDLIQVYDVRAGYFDSVLDGKIPGLEFKLRNSGTRDLTRIEVTAYFADRDGYVIHEEDYLVVYENNWRGTKVLKPGYIWQQERGKFLTAKSVPSEWDGSSVVIKVTELEFGPDRGAERISLRDLADAPGAGSTLPEPELDRPPAEQTAAASAEQAVPPPEKPGARPQDDAARSEAIPRPNPRPGRLEVATAPPLRSPPKPPRSEKMPGNEQIDISQLSALLDKRLDRGHAGVNGNAEPSRKPLSASELAAIRAQFTRCWNPPIGARDAQNLVVKVRIRLRQDGTLLREPVVVNRGDPGDPYWRVAAESAVKAVRKCEPVHGLDPEKYERWRDFELTFNPGDELG